MQYLYKATNLFVAFFLSSLIIESVTAAQEQTNETKKEKSALVYYSLADEFNAPTKEALVDFDCTDKIFSVIELSNYPKGKHLLSVRWIDPSDAQREHTKYEFHVNRAEVRLWAWLSLSRAQGAGMLTWINPAAGLEEFVGEWTVEVRVNNKLISDSAFIVSC